VTGTRARTDQWRTDRWRRGLLGALVASTVLLAMPIATLPAGAQDTPTKSAPPGRPLKADSAAVLLVERAARAYQGARTLRAEFTQTLSNPRTRTDLRSRGEFFQKGAQYFAFKFAQPPEDRIVSDGQVLWLYSPSTAKGQVFKMPRAAGAGMDIVSSVLKEPSRRYTVTALADSTIDGRATRAVLLVPKVQGGMFTRATLWLDVGNALVRKVQFTEASGLVRTLTFSNIRLGSTLPRDAFVFVPPAGVRVIDQAAMLGGSVPR
jgi:outer membrane lipoprotein carrier protein